jgi:DNA invertase Pin-like site-specific DNA recombinase
LTPEHVELAQSLVDSGQTVVSIARAMNVSRQTIYRAIWAKE